MRYAQLVPIAAIGILLAGIAPAQQQPPNENKGMKAEMLSGFDLGKQGLDDYKSRQMRIRQISVEPGGMAAFHSHSNRPALTFVMKGELTEHRKGAGDRIYKPGEVLTESTDVDHWAENKTTETAVLISVDLFKE
jgi:quercetin dioxygenase-like cupin family protein